MSNLSSLNENNISISHISSNPENHQKYFYCSDQKSKSRIINDDNEENIVPNMPLNCECNSCSIDGNNKLFKSLINSKKIKNKELSLLYLINTFNKSYSSESTEKNNNLIIDLPKISKKLFSNSHLRYKSSTTLDIQSFQKNLHIPKYGGEFVNNFFSNIYSSSEEIPNFTNSSKKGGKSSRHLFGSGNKGSSYGISPFNGNYKYGRLFSNNNINCNCLDKGFNLDIKEQNQENNLAEKNKKGGSSLLDNIILNDKNDEKIGSRNEL